MKMASDNVKMDPSSGAGLIKPKKCIICAGVPSEKIVKDNNFMKMMSLYWQGIEVDVKPKENTNFDLCIACFESLIQFYQTNDICIFFEQNLAESRNIVLRKNLKGILKRHEGSEPLTELQMSIQKRWGTKLEPEDANDRLKGYSLKTYIESENEAEASDNHSCTTVSAITTRKTISLDIPQINIPHSSKASVENAAKTSKTSPKKSQRTKRKRGKSSWSSSSESETDELEVSSSNDDSDFVP